MHPYNKLYRPTQHYITLFDPYWSATAMLFIQTCLVFQWTI